MYQMSKAILELGCCQASSIKIGSDRLLSGGGGTARAGGTQRRMTGSAEAEGAGKHIQEGVSREHCNFTTEWCTALINHNAFKNFLPWNCSFAAASGLS